MGLEETEDQRRLLFVTFPTDRFIARLARAAFVVSVLMLGAVQLFVADSYSVVEHTLSESGGQGVTGAWVFRTALLLTAVALFLLTTATLSPWSSVARWWLRMYAIGVVGLAALPEAPWDGRAHDVTVATLHTVAGVIAGVGFVFGVAAVSTARSKRSGVRLFDWAAMAAVAVTPPVMLLVVEFDGLLQRLMVFVGYIWLVAESSRVQADSRYRYRPQATRRSSTPTSR